MSEKSKHLSTKQNVTVEDLLRLKRAERPDPQFWDKFDTELRARYMQNLIVEKPGKRHLLSRLLKGSFALGSTCAASVAIFLAFQSDSHSTGSFSPVVEKRTSSPTPVAEVAEENQRTPALASLPIFEIADVDAISLAASITEGVRAYVMDALNVAALQQEAPFRREMGLKTLQRANSEEVVFVADSLSSGLEKNAASGNTVVRYF